MVWMDEKESIIEGLNFLNESNISLGNEIIALKTEKKFLQVMILSFLGENVELRSVTNSLLERNDWLERWKSTIVDTLQELEHQGDQE
ncbi:hypothetical protein QTG54_015805 [Skeletonema marinoi]|uniref:Uncharacterized protein n=1 Tax=Skeletonema marinoi TaxID=267567 RepID=A0AAD8XTN5_9STRA|nr:hypothetical protein QTG54_015805 [Skeletonema marinoi]